MYGVKKATILTLRDCGFYCIATYISLITNLMHFLYHLHLGIAEKVGYIHGRKNVYTLYTLAYLDNLKHSQ